MARSFAQSSQRYPLTRIFGTEATVRILRELSMHGGQLSAPSLVSRTGLAKGSVRTGLNVLSGLAFVSVKGSGHALLYALRPEHPLRVPVEALFDAEHARFEAIQAAIRNAAKRCEPQPVSTYVYGSVARGEDRPESDLDILVVAPDEDRVSTVTGGMRDALQEAGERIGFRPSVIGLSLGDLASHLGDAGSPWGKSLRGVMVVTGKDPVSLVRSLVLPRRESIV